jgi:SAM-dependent methyltransferase
MQTENERTIFKREIKIFDELGNDPDNVVVINESSNMQMGTGTRVWECDIVLAKYFIKQYLADSKFTKKNVLELGAGTGLLSVILASLGNNVYATDIPELVALMNTNAKENIKTYENKGAVSVFALDWNYEREKIKEILLNKGIKQLDYVVAADVIFNSGQLDTFTKCLKNLYITLQEINPEGKLPLAYLCHKARTDEIDDKIPETLEKLGFWGDQIKDSEMDDQYKSKRIDIFSLEYDEKFSN